MWTSEKEAFLRLAVFEHKHNGRVEWVNVQEALVNKFPDLANLTINSINCKFKRLKKS